MTIAVAVGSSLIRTLRDFGVTSELPVNRALDGLQLDHTS
jgi:hypothetical protein